MYKGEDYLGDIRQIVGCRRCELSQTRNTIPIYRGNPLSDVMIFGEASGPMEDEQGKPMVGPTGGYLVRIMKENGFDLSRIYITNIVLCRPTGDEGRIRAPSEEEIRMCRKWRDLQVKLVDPKIILAVGREAAFAIIPELQGKGSIDDIEGNIYLPAYLNGIMVIPIRHPSGVRRRGMEDHYESSMKTICNKIKTRLEKDGIMF